MFAKEMLRSRRPLDAWYSSSEACAMAGVTYRQLDYWTRTGAARPSVGAYGSGSQRRWSPADISVLRCLGRLALLGCSGSTFIRVGRELSDYATDRQLRGWVFVSWNGEVSVGDAPPQAAGWCIPVERSLEQERRVS